MGWSSLSFPFGSLLTAAQMTQVYSNFASVLAQESGSPAPSGVWSFAAASAIDAPGSHHFGWLKVDSGVAAGGVSSFGQVNAGGGVAAAGVSSFDQISVGCLSAIGKTLQQRVYAAKYAISSIAASVFSTYMVSCITPVYGNSEILVRAELSGMIDVQGGVNGGVMLFNLCAQPNSAAPIVLTNCDGGASISAGLTDVLGYINVPNSTPPTYGSISMTGVDSSRPSGVSVHYGIRAMSPLGTNYMKAARILIEEWR